MGLQAVLIGQLAWLVAAMSGAWLLARLSGNAGWVDAVWSAATGVAVAGGALALGGGEPVRHVLVAVMGGAWSGRLAWHIALRSWGAAHEDPRYAALRAEWGAAYGRKLFGFLLVQAVAAWVLVASVLVAAARPGPLGWRDGAGAVVLALSVLLEGMADAQLRAFKQAKRGPVCDVGLWGWSRHPNYFFEFCAWCAYPVIGFDLGLGAASVVAPLVMFWLLRYGSGVPPLEAAMQASRGALWDAYCARTSIFVPLPPRR